MVTTQAVAVLFNSKYCRLTSRAKYGAFSAYVSAIGMSGRGATPGTRPTTNAQDRAIKEHQNVEFKNAALLMLADW